jgi:hypothetical protein
LSDHIGKNELGGACSKYGGEERCIQGWVGKLMEGEHLEDRGVDGRLILIKKVGGGGVDWIDLAQDRYRWRALVNAVMNLRVT